MKAFFVIASITNERESSMNTISTPLFKRTEMLYVFANKLCETLYGSKERTRLTVALTFAMLVLGISMMQFAQSTNSCTF
jgi:hypothetical protein